MKDIEVLRIDAIETFAKKIKPNNKKLNVLDISANIYARDYFCYGSNIS